MQTRKPALAALIVTLMLLGSGCGSSTPSPQEQAATLADQANAELEGANLGDALALAQQSMALHPSVDAAILVSGSLYALEDVEGAKAALATSAAVDPTRGEDDVFRAFIEADQAGDCALILDQLDRARAANYAALGCTDFWDMVESDDCPWFAYFRASCGGQYAALLAGKTTCSLDAASAAPCPNKLAWENTDLEHRWYLNHFGVSILYNEVAAIDMASSFVPNPYVKVVVKVLRIQSFRIKAKDKGCGVVIHWPKGGLAVAPGAFWVTSQ